ncbi:MAG: glycosyltransferase family 2 protein [Planctomycetota bacterium]
MVIRVRNERGRLRQCLEAVRRQRVGEEVEIVVVDNESEDGSGRVARELGAKVVRIGREEFTWGRALNRGIAAATGELVVILSADAHPADEGWFEEMLAPFADDAVAAVYGRQLARADAPVDEWVRLGRQFPSAPLRLTREGTGQWAVEKAMPISNACAAIRRAVWEAIRFDEEIGGGEDRAWAMEIVRRGHVVVYAPTARVYHWHREGVLRHAWREWELFHKEYKRIGYMDVLRGAAGQAKRRLANVFGAEAATPARARVEGLVRLPFEAGAFALAGFLSLADRGGARWRSAFWR